MMRSLVLTAVALFLLSGCGGGDPAEMAADTGTPAAPAPPGVDRTNPQQVAEEFFRAIDQGDVESASQWVLPEQQTEFLAAMEGVTPQLPEGYEVVVLAQGDRADASIVGAPIEVDMQMREGLWWIAN